MLVELSESVRLRTGLFIGEHPSPGMGTFRATKATLLVAGSLYLGALNDGNKVHSPLIG